MTEKFNIFKWQVDPNYRDYIKQAVQRDESLADDILQMLVSIGEEIGIPFEFAEPEPEKKRPVVWVDKGRNTWDSTAPKETEGWNVS